MGERLPGAGPNNPGKAKLKGTRSERYMAFRSMERLAISPGEFYGYTRRLQMEVLSYELLRADEDDQSNSED